MASFASSITQILESQNVADADVFSAYFVNIFSESHSIDIETAAIMELLNELLSEQLNTDQIALICDEMITCRDFHNNNDSTDQQDLQWEHLVPKGDDDDDDDGNNVGDAYPWTNETAGAEYLDYIEQVWEEGGGGIGEGEGGYEGEGEFGEEDIGYEEDEYYHHYEQLFTKAMEVEEILARVDKCPSIVFSSEAIYAVLWDPYCNGDAETAADSIENAFKTASSAKPCRHMLTGKCYKKDCAFLHEVHDITCRYYLMQQGCAMLSVHDGGDCPFKHTVDVLQLQSQQSSALSSSAAAMKEQDIHSQASFPSLPSASTATPGGAGGGGSARSNGSSSLYAQSEYASALSRSQGGQGLDSGAKTKQTTLTHTGSGGTSSSGRQGSTNLLRSDWVDSGHSVAIDYATLREQARTLAIARNKCLEEATQAYLGGAKGIAKSLSTQGHELNMKMKKCHLQAAKAIFFKRNTSHSILNKGRIDLHGLHVAEALECLEELLPSLRTPSRNRNVTLVTGSGHHSSGPQKGHARLLPAVQGLLDTWGWKYKLVKDDGGWTGGVNVNI